jgi:hypothetical protein
MFKELSNDINTPQVDEFCPLQLPSKDLGIHWNSNFQSGSSFGSVRVHSVTVSYTLGSMRCDSRAFLLACTLVSLCLGREPKATIATIFFKCVYSLFLKFQMTPTPNSLELPIQNNMSFSNFLRSPQCTPH